MKQGRPTTYTKDQINFLKDPANTTAACAKYCDRNKDTIRAKRSRMRAARRLVDVLDLRRVPECVHEMKVRFVPTLGDLVNCIKCGFDPFKIERNGAWIECNTCGRRSHNQMDVKLKFCEACNTFHITQNKRTYPGQTS